MAQPIERVRVYTKEHPGPIIAGSVLLAAIVALAADELVFDPRRNFTPPFGPTATEVATSSVPTAEPKPTPFPNGRLPQGETKTLPANSVIEGDIIVNGQPLYDSNQNTGLIVETTTSISVTSPYGASYREFPDNTMAKQNVVSQENDMLKVKGCENTCTSVNVIVFGNNGIQTENFWAPPLKQP